VVDGRLVRIDVAARAFFAAMRRRKRCTVLE